MSVVAVARGVSAVVGEGRCVQIIDNEIHRFRWNARKYLLDGGMIWR